ncbi:unnamed protein product [Sphacelaria rigidula]
MTKRVGLTVIVRLPCAFFQSVSRTFWLISGEVVDLYASSSIISLKVLSCVEPRIFHTALLRLQAASVPQAIKSHYSRTDNTSMRWTSSSDLVFRGDNEFIFPPSRKGCVVNGQMTKASNK